MVALPLIPAGKLPETHALVSLSSFNETTNEVTYLYCPKVNGKVDESISLEATCHLSKWMGVE